MQLAGCAHVWGCVCAAVFEGLSLCQPWAERLADAAPFVMESRRSLSDYLCGDGR